MKNLNEASAFSKLSPYEIYQQWEEIPIHKGFIVDDLLTLPLGDWQRSGGRAAFVNQDGAGGMCDAVVEEIPPGGELKPQRHMYEKAVFILQGHGATTIWNEGGKKHTLEWQKGSLFSTPLNTWHQHFNAGAAQARYLAIRWGSVKHKLDDKYSRLDQDRATGGDRVPVIFAPAGDPVETGLVRSIASSGNNMTGVSTLSLELTGKRLEMLTKIAPRVKRVAILYNPEYSFSVTVARLAREAGQKLGLTIRDVEGRTEAAMVAAVERLDRREVDALFALPDIMVNNLVKPLAEIARAKRLPYIVHIRSLAEQGPLASYGINTYAIGRQSARLADKIFNGTRPSDIPIETPQKLELIRSTEEEKRSQLKRLRDFQIRTSDPWVQKWEYE